MDKEKAQEIVKMFWGRTARKQKKFSEAEIKPDEFHNWGEMTMIMDRSPTLSNLVKTGGISSITNFVATFEAIMTELELKFDVVPMKTFELKDGTKKHAVVYEVHSLPKWAFRGLGSSDQDALQKAAKSGIEFLIVLA